MRRTGQNNAGRWHAFRCVHGRHRQDDARIRLWAARVGIELEKVRTRSITLNHDGGRWLSLGVGGELPALLCETANGWQRQ